MTRAKGSIGKLWEGQRQRAREQALDAAAARSAAARLGLADPDPGADPVPERAAAQQAAAEAAAFARGRSEGEAERVRLRADLRDATAARDQLAAQMIEATADLAALQARTARRSAEWEALCAAHEAALDELAAVRGGQAAAAAVEVCTAAPTPAALPAVPAPQPPPPPPPPPPRSAPSGAAPARPTIAPSPWRPAPSSVRTPRDPFAPSKSPLDRPDAPRPTPPAPPRLQAACGRGLVDLDGRHGPLLMMAPPRTGGHAALCFAELLDRAARGPVPSACASVSDGEGLDGPPDRRGAQDLRALAELWRHADGFYRSHSIAPGDGLPLVGERLRPAATGPGGSSPALACAEAAHG